MLADSAASWASQLGGGQRLTRCEYGGYRPCSPSSFDRHLPPGDDQSCIDGPQADIFDLEIFIQTLGSALAAEPGFLDAAEGHDFVGEDAFVNADHAGVELLGDAPGAAQILAEQIGGKPERRVVGKPNRIVLGIETDERGDGAEDLLEIGRASCRERV